MTTPLPEALLNESLVAPRLAALLPSAGGAVWLDLFGRALDEAIWASPLGLLAESGALRILTDAGGGVTTASGRVVWARVGGRVARIATGPGALYGAQSGLNRATAFRPVCAVSERKAVVLPDGGEVAVLGPFRGGVEQTYEGTEWPPVHTLVASAAVSALRVYLLESAHGAAAAMTDTGDGRAAVPTIPALDLSGITVPGAPPAAPDLTAPTLPAVIALPADYDTTQATVLADLAEDDTELAQTGIAEQRVILEEWATGVQNQVARFRAEVEVFLAEPRVYESEVAAYRATVEAYSARVSAAVQAYLAEHVQGALAVFQVLERVRLDDLVRVRDGLAQALAIAREERDRRMALLSAGGDPARLLALQAQAG